MNTASTEISLLLVDDEAEFLTVTSTVLTRRGFRVLTADNGLAALAILRREPVDVVVLDIKMPGLDGTEVFDRIQVERPGTPVIILTGHGTIEQAFSMSKAGAWDYLLKPCDMERLVEMAREAAEQRHRLGGEAESPPAPGELVRVLIVDDEASLLESLSRVLRRRHMEVHTAPGGEEAFALLAQTAVDVVVLDVKMPGMGGLEVLSRIGDEYPLLSVILLTGHPTAQDALAGMQLGAFDYLMKPPDTLALTEAIRAAHEHRHQKIREMQERAARQIVEDFPD